MTFFDSINGGGPAQQAKVILNLIVISLSLKKDINLLYLVFIYTHKNGLVTSDTSM